ncbi:MAG: glycosyltransferase family 2 protein [Saprospiraceae bacterium]|nr:glycosyltransferase family 2 protein [Saprospiraceae bacterium]
MKDPFFSIIMPVFNTPYDLLSRAIKSVTLQKFTSWQLIIIEDGPSESFSKAKNDFPKGKVLYLSVPHSGVSHARNVGISNANGDFICFLDSDDAYDPDHLSELYDSISEHGFPQALFRTGMIHHLKNESVKSALYNQSLHRNPVLFILSNNYGPSSCCVTKSVLSEHFFDESSKYFEDTHLFTRILLNYPLYQVSKYTCHVYTHSSQATHVMFLQDDALSQIKNNISTIKSLFSNFREELTEYIPRNFEKQLLSDKYLQHANGLLLANRRSLSTYCIGRSIYFNRKFDNNIYYFKYFLKLIIPQLVINARSRGFW